MNIIKGEVIIIDDQEQCRKVLLESGNADLVNHIEGDGFGFTPIKSKQFYGLAAARKQPTGEVDYKIFALPSTIPSEVVSLIFFKIIEDLAASIGRSTRLEVSSRTNN